ncbi:MAG TPA: TatD family hydrolase, partial [Myxococcota bacterium]|nr:TatD family hydrolase [Myxococcota bacterium]
TELKRAVELGCWFSVGPAMLATKSGRTLIGAMPAARVLTETDGPFAKTDGRALRPAEVGPAVVGLSEIWETDEAEVRETVAENLRQLLRQSPTTLDSASSPPTTPLLKSRSLR